MGFAFGRRRLVESAAVAGDGHNTPSDSQVLANQRPPLGVQLANSASDFGRCVAGNAVARWLEQGVHLHEHSVTRRVGHSQGWQAPWGAQPVCPKPPAPRSDGSSSATTSHWATSNRWTTTWAILSPRRTSNATSGSVFTSTT